MSVPLPQPQPPAPDPAAPTATGGVTILPRTAKQIQHTATYSWIKVVAFSLPAVLVGIGGMTGQLQAMFSPKYAPAIVVFCSLCVTIGQAMQAWQTQQSVKTTATVNFTPQDENGTDKAQAREIIQQTEAQHLADAARREADTRRSIYDPTVEGDRNAFDPVPVEGAGLPRSKATEEQDR